MTELEIRDSSLTEWAESARQAAAIAVSLSKTAFVSSTLKGKPEEVTGAILTGHEVGLAPMAAVRSIDIISGTPAMRAVLMRGLVQAAGHDVWVKEQTTKRAVVCGQRKGSDHVQTSTWTIERATALGLTTKDNWRKQPDAMLVARATAEVCRLIASDVLLGLAYAVEELEETADAEPPRKAKRKPLESVETEPVAEIEAAPEPDVDEPESAAVEESTDWPPVTPPGDAA